MRETATPFQKRTRTALTVLLGLALAVRLAFIFVVFPDHLPESDEVHYHIMAVNIMQGHGPMIDMMAVNIMLGHGPMNDDDLMVYRLPGTSYYLAAVYSVFGVSLRAAQVANALLGMLTVWLLFDLVRRAFSTGAALWAAFFAATYPMLAFYAPQLMSETPTLLLIALSLWLAWRGRSGSLRWLVPLGISLGWAMLTREIMFPAAGLVVLWLLANPPERRLTVRHVGRVALVALLMTAVLVPWWVRNYRVTGEFIPITDAGGARLWYANNPYAAEMGGGELGGALGNMARIPEVEALPEGERDAAYERRARQFIAEDPMRFLGLSFRRQISMWHLSYHGSGKREIVFLLYYWPLLALAVVGAVRAWMVNRSALLLLGITPFVVAGVSAVFQGVGRYRVPAELIFCALGGIATAWIVRRLGERFRRRPAAA